MNCGLRPFLKGKPYFWMRTLCPISVLGFLYSHSGLLDTMDKKSGLYIFLISCLLSIFVWNSGWWRIERNCECTCVHFLSCNDRIDFQKSYYTFSRCSFTVTHCGVILYSSSSADFFKLCNNFCYFIDPKFLGSVLFGNHSPKCTNPIFGIICFHCFCIYGSIKHVLTN